MFIYILVLICSMLGCGHCGCNQQEDKALYANCTNRWLLTTQQQKDVTSFLTRPELLDEICLRHPGKSTDDVDRCVKNNVSPLCGNIRSTWKGRKTQLDIICKYKEKFLSYKSCRENIWFLTQYKRCFNHFGDYRKRSTCIAYGTVLDCMDRAALAYCQGESGRFMKVIFHAFIQPILDHYNCMQERVQEKIVDQAFTVNVNECLDCGSATPVLSMVTIATSLLLRSGVVW